MARPKDVVGKGVSSKPDMGVIILQNPLTTTPLAEVDFSPEGVKLGDTLTVSARGLMENGKPSLVLQQVQIPVIPEHNCTDMDMFDAPSMYCLDASKGRSTAKGKI
jgi:hypothetical protein